MSCSGNLYNICVKQGNSFDVTLTITDSNLNAINISGYSGVAPIKARYGETDILDYFHVNMSNPTGGRLTMNLYGHQTAALPVSQHLYELELYDLSSGVTKYLYGYLEIAPQLSI